MVAWKGLSLGAGRSRVAATGSGCLRALRMVILERPNSRAICRMDLPSRWALRMAPSSSTVSTSLTLREVNVPWGNVHPSGGGCGGSLLDDQIARRWVTFRRSFPARFEALNNLGRDKLVDVHGVPQRSARPLFPGIFPPKRRGVSPSSDLSFGLFQDPETPENRGFLVYLGLLGLRGSSGTARKQPESTKLGPRKSESLVRGSPCSLKATGSNYFTCGSVAFGLMEMSYFGSVAERCRRASISFISLAGTRTPSGYTPWRRLTVGCSPFQVIRRTHCRTTFRQVRSTPFHFFSNADQHRSIGLYLLWYGG